MSDLLAYAGLFLAALAAATILPMQSEALLVGLLLADAHSTALLLIIASIGNTAGSAINWVLGRSLERYRNRRWFPASPASFERAQSWYRRHGCWSLLLSWMPVIGDPLTVVASVMREPFLPFLLLVAFAKTARYLVLAGVTLGLM